LIGLDRSDHRAEDLVDRQVRRNRANELWLTDITEHPTREGEVYCAALGMAIEQRDTIRGMEIHSDHETQFTAWTFSDRTRKSGLLPSMGTVGDCYDNAMMEAFWSRMQVELLDTADGERASSSRPPSSNTSRSSTTAGAAIRASAC
jgi:transposase InsO family protein